MISQFVWRIAFEGLFSHRIVDASSSKNELGIEIRSSVCVRFVSRDDGFL